MYKISVEYGPLLREAAKVERETFEIASLHLDDLIAEVCRRRPLLCRAWLVDVDTGRLSQNVLVAVNGVATRERDPEIRDGDSVFFTPILAGG